MSGPERCWHCGAVIVLADDRSRWLHDHPVQPYLRCQGFTATPKPRGVR